MAARFNLRTQALIRLGGGRTTSVAEHAAHAITELVRRPTDALFPLCDERRFAVERARVLRCTSGRRAIRIMASLPIHCIIDQSGEISLNATFTVCAGKAPKITIALDSSGQRRDTQADINAGLIIRAREVEVDGRKTRFVDGSADVERRASRYMLSEGTCNTGRREREYERRNNEARKAH